MLHQQVWARDPATIGQKHSRNQTETKDKESQRWLTAVDRTEKVMPESITVLTVAARVADIYDFLATERPENSQLLIRGYHNPQVKNSDGTKEVLRLQGSLAQVPSAGQLDLELPANPQRSARKATLNLQATTVEILPPQSHPRHQNLQPLRVQVILAC